MTFWKSKCSECKGTGVKEYESYHLGVDFFLLAIELALPLAGIALPLYLLSVLGVGVDEMLQYWQLILGVSLLFLLASLWFLPAILKCLIYTHCSKCGGSGRVKRKEDI